MTTTIDVEGAHTRRARDIAQAVGIELCAGRSCGGCVCDDALDLAAEPIAAALAAVERERDEVERRIAGWQDALEVSEARLAAAERLRDEWAAASARFAGQARTVEAETIERCLAAIDARAPASGSPGWSWYADAREAVEALSPATGKAGAVDAEEPHG